MLTRKPCKHCGSFYHSKNKCPKVENRPLKAVYKAKGTQVAFNAENGSERPRLAYKGNGERSQLIGYADKYFSLYIRRRGSDGVYNDCYTCSARLPIEELQCGHFIPRRYLQTRWNKLNCWPQCNECNVEKRGNLIVFELLLRKEFGDLAVDTLFEMSRNGKKVTTADIQAIVDEYNGLVF